MKTFQYLKAIWGLKRCLCLWLKKFCFNQTHLNLCLEKRCVWYRRYIKRGRKKAVGEKLEYDNALKWLLKGMAHLKEETAWIKTSIHVYTLKILHVRHSWFLSEPSLYYLNFDNSNIQQKIENVHSREIVVFNFDGRCINITNLCNSYFGFHIYTYRVCICYYTYIYIYIA